MLVLGFGQFLSGSKVRPIVPITLGVTSIISIIGFMPWPVFCPVGVIVITPAFFGMGCFLFFGGLWGTRRCCLCDVCLWRLLLLLKWVTSFALSISFACGLLWRHSFERILTFHSFLALLAFSFAFSPEAVSCWSSFPCCITFSFWPRAEAGSWSFSSFLSITFWFTFLEGPAVDTALRVWTLSA